MCEKFWEPIFEEERRQLLYSIMLKISNSRVATSLLSLLAFVFTTMGMPLVHAAVHSHLDHQQAKAGHCEEHLPVIPDDDHNQDCPICYFQATIHLFAGDISSINLADEPIISILPIFHISSVKDRQEQSEPRAPPESTYS